MKLAIDVSLVESVLTAETCQLFVSYNHTVLPPVRDSRSYCDEMHGDSGCVKCDYSCYS